MKICVLGSAESWYVRDLQRAVASGESLAVVPFSELSTGWDSEPHEPERIGGEAVDLQAFDVVLVRSMPPGSLEQVVFRMDALQRLEAQGVAIVNSPRALETAIDKYLALSRLRAAGLPVPATCVCQTVEQAMEAFMRLGQDVVVKPLFGGEGRGLARLQDPDVALRVFKALTQIQSVLYLQEFLPHHGYDVRLLVIGQEVLAMKRVNPDDWRTNIGRGARAESLVVPASWEQLARDAAATLGTCLAGVDLLPTRDGRVVLLEVNGVPGWRALGRLHEIDVARRVLDELAAQVATVGRRA